MRGRKRKKYTITIEQMESYRQLSERLQLDRIINNTTIFNPPADYGQEMNFHQETADAIKNDFILWFNSWVKPHLDKM